MKRFWLPLLVLFLVAGAVLWIYIWLKPDAQFDRDVAKTLGTSQYIRCFSGGQVILEDVSTGKVYSETNSDGYFWTSAWDGHFYESNADCFFRSASKAERHIPKDHPTFIPPQRRSTLPALPLKATGK